MLNERLRWDFNELFAEMATNGYRRPADNTWIPFPRGYLANLEVSEESRIVYLPYFNTASQSNYQADEINVRGQYDLTFLLPPVPNEGTYELRICAPSNTGFGMAQIYFGTDKLNLQPVGLPIDLRIPPTNPNIGWEQDTEDIEHNNENDKIMRNHGYMKPPRHDGIWNGGSRGYRIYEKHNIVCRQPAYAQNTVDRKRGTDQEVLCARKELAKQPERMFPARIHGMVSETHLQRSRA